MPKKIQVRKCLLIMVIIFLPINTILLANNPVAIINSDGVIFDYDIEEHLKYLEITNSEDKKAFLKDKEIKNIILNKIIDNYLIKKEANKFGIDVTESELENALDNIAKSLKYNNREAFLANSKKQGLSLERLKALLMDDVLSDKFKQSISYSRVSASENEIALELEKMLDLNGKVEFLLYEISMTDINPQATEQKLQLLEKNLTPQNFESFAQKFSDNLNANKGGLIGWVPQVYLPNEILNVLMKMKPNSISKPILIGNSYKIFYMKDARGLLSINPNNPDHMKKLNEYARQKIIYDKIQIMVEDYIKELYQNATITIYN
jgi:peptidyl-prolyl cis-trans isomerase SurA